MSTTPIPNTVNHSLLDLYTSPWFRRNPHQMPAWLRPLNTDIAFAIGGFGSSVASDKDKNLHATVYGRGSNQGFDINRGVFNPKDLPDGYNLLLSDGRFQSYSNLATGGAGRKYIKEMAAIVNGHVISSDANGEMKVDGKALNLAKLDDPMYDSLGPLRTEVVKDPATGKETTYIAREFADNNKYFYGAIGTIKGAVDANGKATEGFLVSPEYLQHWGRRDKTDPITGDRIHYYDITFSTGSRGVDGFDRGQPIGVFGDTLRTPLRDMRTGQINQDPFYFLGFNLEDYFSQLIQQYFNWPAR